MAAVLFRGLQGLGTNHASSPYDEQQRGCLESPFAAYYIVVLSTNSVAILAGVFSQLDYHYNQHHYRYNRIDIWYLCNAVFGAAHIAAAVYMVHRIQASPTTPPAVATAYYLQTADQAAPVRATAIPVGASYPTTPYPPTTVGHPTADGLYRNDVYNMKPITKPNSWGRVRQVICEDKIVAAYIVVFVIYLLWHTFFDYHTWYASMRFVMRCADIFVVAGPSSFVFSLAYLFIQQQRS